MGLHSLGSTFCALSLSVLAIAMACIATLAALATTWTTALVIFACLVAIIHSLSVCLILVFEWFIILSLPWWDCLVLIAHFAETAYSLTVYADHFCLPSWDLLLIPYSLSFLIDDNIGLCLYTYLFLLWEFVSLYVSYNVWTCWYIYICGTLLQTIYMTLIGYTIYNRLCVHISASLILLIQMW